MRSFILALIIFLPNHLLADQGAGLDSLPLSIDIETVVVTAQLKPKKLNETLHSIELIDSKQIAQRGATSLDEILSLSANIQIHHDPILGKRIIMRGISSENVALLIDGIPVIGRNNGAIDLSQISALGVERIEILEGPVSDIYGGNAGSGAINIITTKPENRGVQSVLSHQRESVGNQQSEALVQYKSSSWFLQGEGRFFTYEKHPMDSMRIREKQVLDDSTTQWTRKYPWNPKDQYNLGLKLGYDIVNKRSIIAQWRKSKESVRQFGAIRRPQFRPYAQDEEFETLRDDYSVQYKGLIFDQNYQLVLSHNSYSRYTHDKRYLVDSSKYDTALSSTDTAQFHNVFSRVYTGIELCEKLSMTLGLNYSRESGEGSRLSPEDTLSNQVQFEEWALNHKWLFQPHDQIDIGLSSRIVHHSAYGWQFTPAFQLRYQIDDKWTSRISVSQGYRNPELKELYLEFIDVNHHILGNPALKPELNHEIQSSLAFETKTLETKLRMHYTWIEDRIILAFDDEQRARYENVSKFYSTGAQLEANGQWNNWNIQASYYYNLNRSDINNENNRWNRNGTVSAQLNYNFSRMPINFSAQYRHEGAQLTYLSNDESLKEFESRPLNFLDISGQYKFWSERIRLVVGIKNLFDHKYQLRQSTNNAHQDTGRQLISQGRNFFIRMSLNLGKLESLL